MTRLNGLQSGPYSYSTCVLGGVVACLQHYV